MQQIKMYDQSGKAVESISCNIDIQPKNISEKAYATAVRVLLQNWRQGTVGCKGRGEVSLSTKKPWRQKGTGRARAGSARSPLWRKGGVIFGCQKRVRTLSFNRRLRKDVLSGIFSDFSSAGKISCLDVSFDGEKQKTKNAYGLLKKMGLEQKKLLFFVSYQDISAYNVLRNIANVNIVFFDSCNVFDLTNSSSWLFFKKDLALFEKMVARWN